MILGIAGEAGSGKDTISGIIKKLVPNTLVVALADPLKSLVQALYGFENDILWGPSALRSTSEVNYSRKRALDAYDALDNETLKELFPDKKARKAFYEKLGRAIKYNLSEYPSCRECLKEIGTEVARNIDPNVWVKAVMGLANVYLSDSIDLVVISDCRFRNEILTIKQAGGKVLRIINPNQIDLAKDLHTSESSLAKIPSYWFDWQMVNDKSFGLEALEEKLRDFRGELLWRAHS